MANDPLAFHILHEDADLLVIDKPPGLITSSTPRERRPTLLGLLRLLVNERNGPLVRIGLIHRLDGDASGLLVFSKNDDAFRLLKAQFFDRTAGRVYAAVTKGIPKTPSGKLESRLVEWTDGTVHTTLAPSKGDLAITHYVVIKQGTDRALLRVKLETGRKHQIRAHLSEQGTPILGDKLYGGLVKGVDRLMLHAMELTIVHPRTGKTMKFTSTMPKAFSKFLNPQR